MPTEVKAYEVRIYGSEEGYQHNRAQITLFNAEDKPEAYVRFRDPGVEFDEDGKESGPGRMYMPLAALESTLQLLAHHESVSVHFASGRGILTGGKMAIGGEAPRAKKKPVVKSKFEASANRRPSAKER